MRAFLLYMITAAAEILGCYTIYLWLRLDRPAWWIIPGIIFLGLFACLLTLHPIASGRIYAAYGGVYIAASVLWLWLADGVQPDALGLAWLGDVLTWLGTDLLRTARLTRPLVFERSGKLSFALREIATATRLCFLQGHTTGAQGSDLAVDRSELRNGCLSPKSSR